LGGLFIVRYGLAESFLSQIITVAFWCNTCKGQKQLVKSSNRKFAIRYSSLLLDRFLALMLVLQCCLCICNMFFIINWVDCLLSGMALRRVFCLRSSLSLSDAILARGRNSLSNQATANIPLGSGNMVSSYGPPCFSAFSLGNNSTSCIPAK
jgi:hypothetical protein